MGSNPTILIATDEELKDQNAKLKANLEEEQKARKALEDKDKETSAKLKAIDEEDKVEHAKKAIKAAAEEEDDPVKKAALMKATEIFETQKSGITVDDELKATKEEEEKTAVIASLTADASKPLIAGILKAQLVAGATPEALKATKETLAKLSYTALKATYASQEVYINKALSAKTIETSEEALTAAVEAGIDFNGESFSLTGKIVNLDDAMGRSN